MKKILFLIMFCTSIIARADNINGSCLIGETDYVEADFFYNLNGGRITNGIITIANGSNIPIVSLNIEITAVNSMGKEIVIYKDYAKFNPNISGYSTYQIKDISYTGSFNLSDIKISISNPRCTAD